MDSGTNNLGDNNFPWHLNVFDAHCHPTDVMHNISLATSMKARGLTVMATRSQDQELVEQSAYSYAIHDAIDIADETRQRCIIPCFGWHPWFSHHIYDDTTSQAIDPKGENFKFEHYQSVLSPFPDDIKFLEALPQPRSLSNFLRDTRTRLEKFPAALIGEIGLDKSFRIPEEFSSDTEVSRDATNTPGRREGRRLTTFRVKMEHQKAILKAQLRLAGELGRPVSIHSVQAHGNLFNTLQEVWKIPDELRYGKKKTHPSNSIDASQVSSNLSSTRLYPPRICLHSYSGSLEQAKQYLTPAIPADIYFSFSSLINNFSNTKVIEVIKAVKDDRILAESDFDSAGDEMDNLLQQACRQICEIKGWELDDGVAKLGMNWHRFIFSDNC